MLVFWAIFLAVGVLADPIDESEVGQALHEIVESFKNGLDNIVPLEIFLDLPDLYQLDKIEEDIQTSVTEIFKESLYEVLETVEDSLFTTSQLTNEALQTSREFMQKIETEFVGKEDEAREIVLNWAHDFTFRVKVALKYIEAYYMEHVTKERIVQNLKDSVKRKITVGKIRDYVYEEFSDHPQLAEDIWNEIHATIFPKIDEFLNNIFDKIVLTKEDRSFTYWVSCKLLKMILNGYADADKIIEFIKNYLPANIQGKYMDIFLEYGIKGLTRFLQTICILTAPEVTQAALPNNVIQDFGIWLQQMITNGFKSATKPIGVFIRSTSEVIKTMKLMLADGFKQSLDTLKGLSKLLGEDFIDEIEQIKDAMDDIFSSSI